MGALVMKTENERFKKAVVISISIHVALFVFLIVSPHLPKPSRRGMIHYVNIYSLPGGGGGGGGGGETASLKNPTEEVTETPAPAPETLKDLTTPPKLEEQAASALRYPVENPEKEKAPPSEKKAVIEKQQPSTKTSQPAGKEAGTTGGTGSGSGIKIGIGGGSGSGTGIGSEFASEIGLTQFPYTYYIRLLLNKISSNWIKSYQGPEKLYTTVLFRIYRNGEAGGLQVVENSTVPSLDRSAVRAIYSSSPFAPLPQGYQFEYLEIQLIFEHSK